MATRSPFTAIGTTLRTVAERFGLSARLMEQRLQREWVTIVGDSIAAHTRPDGLRFKKLYLIVENSVWLQQLTFLKPSLLLKIDAALGTATIVTDIVLRVGDIGPQTRSAVAETPTPDQDPVLTVEEDAESTRHAQAIADADLRAYFSVVMGRAVKGDPRRRKPPLPGL